MRKCLQLNLTLVALLAMQGLSQAQTPKLDSLRSQFDPGNESSAAVLNQIAYEYLKSNYDSSRVFTDSAYNQAKRFGRYDEMAKSRITSGISYYYSGLHEQALNLYLQALTIADSLGDRALQAAALNEMGVLHRKQGDLKRSEETFLRALELGKTLADSSLIANSMNHLGVTYDIQEKFEEAMALFQASALIKERLGDTFGLTFNLDNMGQTSAKMGRYAEGEAYFVRAAAIRKQLNDETGYAITINNIGELYQMKGDHKRALTYFEQALKAAEKLDFKDFRSHLYRVLSETHKANSNFRLAYEYLDKYTSLRDSIFNEQRSKQILELQTKYETEKKEQEIQIRDLRLAEQDLLLSQKNLQLYSSIGGAGVLLVLLYLAFNRLQLQKRVQQLELVQKMQSERERISADLHDHVGAQLTSILSGLQITEQIDSFQKDQKIREVINSLKEDAHETITSLRASIWSLHQNEIAAQDFVEHIEKNLASLVKYQPKLTYEIRSDLGEGFVLGSREALNLTRTIQEAVQNVIKHAAATSIIITISKKEKLTIWITDNGKGFDPHKLSDGENFGLLNMKRRMEEIGGTLNVISAPGEGTTIFARV